MIGSLASREYTAENLSVEQLQKAIQDGTIPAYVGVPMLQDKVNQQKTAQGLAAAKNQPQQTIAQSIMSEAGQGVTALPSNMPVGASGGGIVAFADGGLSEDDDDDEEERQDSALFKSLLGRLQAPVSGEEDEDIDVNMTQPEQPQAQHQAIAALQPAPQAMPQAAPQGIAQLDESEKLRRHILGKESGGKRYDKEGHLLKSSEGALGEMQVMPATAKDPGFGIAPAKDVNNPDELKRVGEQYADALLHKYQNPTLAAIAYNWGTGNADKWLANGADISKLPKETQNYIKGINFARGGIVGLASGGEVKHYQGAGGSLVFSDIAGGEPYSLGANNAFQSSGGIGNLGTSTAASSAPSNAFTADELAAGVQRAKAASNFVPKYPLASGAAEAGAAGLLTPAGIVGLGAPIAATMAYKGLTGPNNADIPTALGANPGGATLEEIEAAKHPALIYPNMGKKRFTQNVPIRKDEAPTAITSLLPAPADVTPSKPLPAATIGHRTKGGPGYGEVEAYNSTPTTPPLGDMDIGFGANQFEPTGEPEKRPTGIEALPTKPEESSDISDFRQKLKDMEFDSKKSKEQDMWLAVLQAGLGMMGGTSQYAMSNIGQGGAQGLQYLATANKQRGDEQKQIMAAQLGLSKTELYDQMRRDALAQRSEAQKAETERKSTSAAANLAQRQASLNERQQKDLSDYISKAEKDAELNAVANTKGDILMNMNPAQLEQARAEMKRKALMGNAYYRQAHQKLGLPDPFANTQPTTTGATRIKYDSSGKQIG